jgi:GMP synthase-like glutamine amidotransferase
MQVIAMALGGLQAVVPNEKGWEIGVYEVGLTDAGRDWFGRVMAGGVDSRLKDAEDVESASERVAERVVGTEKIVSCSLGMLDGWERNRLADKSGFAILCCRLWL